MKYFESLLLILFILPSLAMGENQKTGKGWFNYNYEPPKLIEDATEDNEQPAYGPLAIDFSDDQLWNMHPKEFRQIIENTRQRAVQTLKVEDVRQYRRIQKVASTKSVAFASVFGMEAEKNPTFDWKNPTTNPGIYAKQRLVNEDMKERLQAASSEFALLFFHSPACKQFCPAQESILIKFAREHPDWEIAKINVLDDPLKATRFGVEKVPTLFMVQKNNPEPMAISLGVISLSDMKKRIYRNIRLRRGQTDPTKYYKRSFED